MIEVYVAFPAVDERAGVEIFYATDAEHAVPRRARRSRRTIHAQTSSGSLGPPVGTAPFKRR